MSDELKNPVSRRGLLQGAAALAAARAMGVQVAGAAPVDQPAPAPKPAGAMRFVHMTDIHIKPEMRAPEGFAACLKSLDKLDPQPEFIVTGGDHVIDSLRQRAPRANELWDLYQKVLSENNKRPVYPVIGNHDCMGWSLETLPHDTPGYGKALAMERLGMKQPYHSWDKGGWHFIALDNIVHRGNGYYADLDEAQDRWLSDDLEKTGPKTPICIFSHISLVSVAAVFCMTTFKEKEYRLPDSILHHNVEPLLERFSKYNVRLLVSGHLHMVDRIDYKGMCFICDGAVCAAWWEGLRNGFAEGYGVFDVWPDGRFEHQYVTYGWKAK